MIAGFTTITALVPMTQRVAVGRRAASPVTMPGMPAPPPMFSTTTDWSHSFAERLGDDARGEVGRLARGERHDELHRLVGVLRVRRAERDEQHRGERVDESADHGDLLLLVVFGTC